MNNVEGKLLKVTILWTTTIYYAVHRGSNFGTLLINSTTEKYCLVAEMENLKEENENLKEKNENLKQENKKLKKKAQSRVKRRYAYHREL